MISQILWYDECIANVLIYEYVISDKAILKWSNLKKILLYNIFLKMNWR